MAPRIIRAEHLGHVLWRARRDRAGARRTPKPAPLTILGDLVHNPAVLADLRAKGIAIAHDAGAGEDAHRDGDGAWRIGTDARQHPRPRPGGRRGDLPARARGASGGQGARARRLSPGHHRPARPRRGPRTDRDLDDFDVVLDDDDVLALERPSAHRHRRPDDAADREGATPGRADSAAIPSSPTSASSTPSASRRSSARTPPSSWRANATSSSSSAARTATTRASS